MNLVIGTELQHSDVANNSVVNSTLIDVPAIVINGVGDAVEANTGDADNDSAGAHTLLTCKR